MDLVPAEPLSQVVFVHDYVQLVFQGETFSLFNRLRVTGPQTAMQGETEFPGLLVALIGQQVTRAAEGSVAMLELHFQSGSTVQVLRGEEFASGSEAYMFAGHGDVLVVEQN